jgi:DNA-binding CsgD family transcriptional regulator
MRWLADSFGAGKPAELRGRSDECAILDGLLETVRQGRSAAVVLRGEAGMGKTALLRHATQAAADFRVTRTSGVEPEMEIAFAALHQLCSPFLNQRDHLPEPQRDALGIAFGCRAGPAPDQFLIGLAVLSLLSGAAAQHALLCVIDDAQWLDPASARVLAFVARRLPAEPVLMVFAAREPVQDLRGLPELVIAGLPDDDARALLAQGVRWPLDDRVREQILAETRGIPLALLEFPRGLPPGELAGGFGLPGAAGLASRIDDGLLRRIAALPTPARMLLLVAAAEPTGNRSLVARAAAQLGLNIDAATDAQAAELADFGLRVRFRYPLVRSAVYRAASPAERRRAHHALAQAIDPRADPDRRAWHRAQATVEPEEDVAAELEQCAGRAQERGGVAAAAAFLERAAELTVDPARRAGRAVAAAQAKHAAGAPGAAAGLLLRAEAGPADPLLRARVSLLRGQLAFASGRSAQAPDLLLATARQFERAAPGLARETYLDALAAALLAGRLAAVAGLADIAGAVRRAPAAPPSGAPDLLLDGLTAVIHDGYAAGAPVLERAVRVLRRGRLPVQDAIRWSFVACHSAHDLWDDQAWHELSARHLQLARDAGAVGQLPLALIQRVGLHLHAGEFAAAAALVEETEVITEATGNELPPYGALALASWRGRAEEANELLQATMRRATIRGEGMGLSLAQYSSAVLNNGLGRYEEALAAADRASAYPAELGFANFALAEAVEAAARTGETKRATDAFDLLTQTTGPCGTPWALGLEARCRALLSEDDDVEPLYIVAIGQLSRCRGAVLLARTRLLYGEWLRRANRRIDARAQLRAAHETLVTAGAEAFAERARRELAATGETVRKRVVSSRDELTAQERQIGYRARDGRTNSEIGAELFLSPRTVEWHLRKIFAKLGIGSRRELRSALPMTWEGGIRGEGEVAGRQPHPARVIPAPRVGARDFHGGDGVPRVRSLGHAEPGDAGRDGRPQGRAAGQCQPDPAHAGRAPGRLRPGGPPSSGA